MTREDRAFADRLIAHSLPQFSRAAERELLVQAQAGDRTAEGLLLRSTIKFVVREAWRRSRRHGAAGAFEDLCQAALIAVVTGIRDHNLSDNRILTHAKPKIHSALTNGIAQALEIKGTTPRAVFLMRPRIDVYASRLGLEADTNMVIDYLVKRWPRSFNYDINKCRVSTETVLTGTLDQNRIVPARAHVSTENAIVDGKSLVLADKSAGAETRVAEQQFVTQALSKVSAIQAEVVKARVFGELEFDTIGARFKHSGEWARQVYLKAIAKLKRYFKQHELEERAQQNEHLPVAKSALSV